MFRCDHLNREGDGVVLLKNVWCQLAFFIPIHNYHNTYLPIKGYVRFIVCTYPCMYVCLYICMFVFM